MKWRHWRDHLIYFFFHINCQNLNFVFSIERLYVLFEGWCCVLGVCLSCSVVELYSVLFLCSFSLSCIILTNALNRNVSSSPPLTRHTCIIMPYICTITIPVYWPMCIVHILPNTIRHKLLHKTNGYIKCATKLKTSQYLFHATVINLSMVYMKLYSYKCLKR